MASDQKSTVDVAMAIKYFIKESLEAGKVIVLVSLDVQGAFYAAWWPGVLREMKVWKCSRYLYKLAMSYFTQRTAALTKNSLRIEKEVTRRFPQGACCGPGFWNLQFNSHMKINFMERTKVVAYPDDLLVATKGHSVRAVEN